MVTKKLNHVLKKLVHVGRHDNMPTGPETAAMRALSFSSSEFSQSLGSETSVDSGVDVDGDDDEECGRFEVPKDVPEGSLPVYVGQERRRFVIPTSYLSNNIFRALLAKSEDEFGLRCHGGLRIACTPDVFQHFLWWLEWEATQATRCSDDDDSLVHLSLSTSSSDCLVLDT